MYTVVSDCRLHLAVTLKAEEGCANPACGGCATLLVEYQGEEPMPIMQYVNDTGEFIIDEGFKDFVRKCATGEHRPGVDHKGADHGRN